MKDHRKTRPSIVGRGAAHNPHNRCGRVSIELDAEDREEPERPETVCLKDYARTITATNASVNPYRGRSNGYSYCMTGDTPISMGDGTTRSLEDLQVGDEIHGTVPLPDPPLSRSARGTWAAGRGYPGSACRRYPPRLSDGRNIQTSSADGYFGR